MVDSPLSQVYEKDGHTVKVDINSTVWNSTYETAELVWEEFKRAIEEEDIESTTGPVDSVHRQHRRQPQGR
jgi:hypothetical protein